MSLETRYELAMMGQLNLLNQLYAVQAELAEARQIIGKLNAEIQELKNNGEQGNISGGHPGDVSIDNGTDGDGKATSAG